MRYLYAQIVVHYDYNVISILNLPSQRKDRSS
jgi:hypothetical protein